MLIGSYNHSTDLKGRIFIPVKWRQDLGVGFVITRGIGGCLFGMSLQEWEKLSTKLACLPLTNQRAQTINRQLSRWATECEQDKQGRVLITQKLRDIAQIGEEVTLIGMTNHIEIWSTAVLEARDLEEGDDYESVLAEASALGI